MAVRRYLELPTQSIGRLMVMRGQMRINERYYLYIDNGTQVPIGDGKKKAQYRIGCLSDGKKKKKKKKNEEEGVDKEQQSPSSIGKNIRSWLKDVDEFWEGMKDELGVFFEEEEEEQG